MTVTFRISHTDASVNLGVTLLPSGPAYSASGDSFVKGPPNVTATAGPRPIHRGVGWGFVISGSVRDTSGSPVSGAPILLGTEVVLSNDAGAVMLRRKRPGSVTVRVDLDQFQQPGK